MRALSGKSRSNSSNSKSSGGGVGGFLKYVFNFDDPNKHALFNMMQYTSLSILPVLLLLKAVKHFIPEDDSSKGSIEILAESVGQLLFIMIAIWFINKAIYYIPTYSGTEYKGFNETNFILPFVIILATMQTKLGAKFQILIERALNKWHGREGYSEYSSEEEQQKQQQQQQQQSDGGGVRVTQPLSGMPSYNTMAPNLLPADRRTTQMPQAMATKQVSKQQQPRTDFSSMYDTNNQTPMVGAASPGMGMMNINEPMAANEMGGGWGTPF